MNKRTLIILIISSLASFSLYGQRYDFVKILPGKGIVYNSDTILLQKTKIRELCKVFKVKAPPKLNEFDVTMWDGYNSETGRDTSGSYYETHIKYKSIDFEYTDDNNVDSLKLSLIRIKQSKGLKIYTDNGFIIGDVNPKIKEVYSDLKKKDYVSDNKLTYKLYTYGISFHLEKLINGDLRLVEISTHYKIEK